MEGVGKESGGKKERLPFYHFRRLCQYHGFLQGSYQILHRVEAGGLILQEQGGIDSALSKDFLDMAVWGEGDNFVVAGKDYFMFPTMVPPRMEEMPISCFFALFAHRMALIDVLGGV